MDIIISTTSSLVLRYVLNEFLPPPYSSSMLVPIFLGLLEGSWLHMLVSSMPASYDPYLAFLLRPIMDFFVSGSLTYVFTVVLWSILAMLALDVMGPQHGHDTRRGRRRESKRPIPSRMGSSHTNHTVLQTKRSSRSLSRRSRSRSLTFVLPATSPESGNPLSPPESQPQSGPSSQPSSQPSSNPSASSSFSSGTLHRSSSATTITIDPYESPATMPITNTFMSHQQPITPLRSPSPPAVTAIESPIPASSPIESMSLLQPPVQARIELVVPTIDGPRSNFPRSPFPSTSREQLSPPPAVTAAVVSVAPNENTITADRQSNSPIPVPAPGFIPGTIIETNLPIVPVATSAPVIPEHYHYQPPQQPQPHRSHRSDPLQTPVLRGFEHVQVDSDIEVDELTTPPHLRAHHPPASFMQVLEGAIIEEPPIAGPSLLLHTQHAQATAAANANPLPVPPPGGPISPALSALDMLSPRTTSSLGQSVISTKDPEQLFERAELLRNKAWKEVQEKTRLKAELQQARAEGRRKDAFILSGDVKDCEHRIDTLHARASRRYLMAKNPEEMIQGDEIDVHGLLVEEAIEATEAAFRKALKNGKDRLRVIVGKGNHSKDKTPKLKPAVTAAMKNHGFQCTVDAHNPGVLLLTV